MKALLSLAVILASTVAFADINLSQCESILMSQPNCVNRINATRFCKNIGNSKEIADMASKCIADMSAGTKPTNSTIMMCLGGFSTSTNPADNETLCK
jgi:hypothetical protein